MHAFTRAQRGATPTVQHPRNNHVCGCAAGRSPPIGSPVRPAKCQETAGEQNQERLPGRGNFGKVHGVGGGADADSSKSEHQPQEAYPPEDPVRWLCIQTFVEKNSALDLHRRETEGTGKKDKNEAWSKARLAAFTELLQWIQYSLDPTLMGTAPGPPINIFAMMWYYEHHDWVRSGYASKYQCLVSQDDSGKISAPSKGGQVPTT